MAITARLPINRVPIPARNIIAYGVPTIIGDKLAVESSCHMHMLYTLSDSQAAQYARVLLSSSDFGKVGEVAHGFPPCPAAVSYAARCSAAALAVE